MDLSSRSKISGSFANYKHHNLIPIFVVAVVLVIIIILLVIADVVVITNEIFSVSTAPNAPPLMSSKLLVGFQ